MAENIRRAKLCAFARRFYNKDLVHATELVGVLSFWLGAGFPEKSLDDYLDALMPPSGWLPTEQPSWVASRRARRMVLTHDPVNRVRRRQNYGQAFKDLLEGKWEKWL